MSAHNAELTRRFIAAFNARHVDGLIAYCDPSVELHSSFEVVGGGIYHGHDGIRRWHRDLQDVWGEEIRVESEAFFDLGEHLLSFYALQGRGQVSGVETAMPNASVARWHDGLLVYFKAYTDRQQAMRDLGVTEDELEPIEP
jgi:ketosteroid isomerase-like protein